MDEEPRQRSTEGRREERRSAAKGMKEDFSTGMKRGSPSQGFRPAGIPLSSRKSQRTTERV